MDNVGKYFLAYFNVFFIQKWNLKLPQKYPLDTHGYKILHTVPFLKSQTK